MAQSREILTINVGQCGIYLGHSVLEQYCAEHKIDPLGNQKYRKIGAMKILYDHYIEKDDAKFNHSISTCFKEMYDGRYTARNILVDTDPDSIEHIQNDDLYNAYLNLYDTNSFISGKENAATNFARGHYTVGRELISTIMDEIRTQTENCENVQGFIMHHSVGGGTGSGLGTLILEHLSVNYRKKSKVTDNNVYCSIFLFFDCMLMIQTVWSICISIPWYLALEKKDRY